MIGHLAPLHHASRDFLARWKAAERIALLEAILAEYNKRYEEFAVAMSTEMGAPMAWAREAQAWAALCWAAAGRPFSTVRYLSSRPVPCRSPCHPPGAVRAGSCSSRHPWGT